MKLFSSDTKLKLGNNEGEKLMCVCVSKNCSKDSLTPHQKFLSVSLSTLFRLKGGSQRLNVIFESQSQYQMAKLKQRSRIFGLETCSSSGPDHGSLLLHSDAFIHTPNIYQSWICAFLHSTQIPNSSWTCHLSLALPLPHLHIQWPTKNCFSFLSKSSEPFASSLVVLCVIIVELPCARKLSRFRKNHVTLVRKNLNKWHYAPWFTIFCLLGHFHAGNFRAVLWHQSSHPGHIWFLSSSVFLSLNALAHVFTHIGIFALLKQSP